MKNRTLNAFIVLGAMLVLSGLFMQCVRVQTSIPKSTTGAQQSQDDSLNAAFFSEKTMIALKNVSQTIVEQQEIKTASAGGVTQLSPASFSVELNDLLLPHQLDKLLQEEFYKQKIHEDFVVGIYNVFLDSITFGNVNEFNALDSSYQSVGKSKNGSFLDEKWINDGHYFTVSFPNLEK